MSYQPKILAFAGSLRTDSYNKKLVKIAVKGAQESGASVTYIDLRDFPLPIYDQEIQESQGMPQNALKIKELMMQHDGFLISCPEYNSSMSGVFKNTIDWASRQAKPDEVFLSCFINKVVLLMSASTGQLGGLRGLVHVRSMFSNINCIVLPQQKSISKADSAFNKENDLIDPKQHADIVNLGKQLSEFLKIYKGSKLA